MSDLSGIDKLHLEKYLQMGSGYVLDFSNRTFQEFILEHAHLDIYDDNYEYTGGSKANRLRQLWKVESNYVAGVIIDAFIEYRGVMLLDEYHKEIPKEGQLKEACDTYIYIFYITESYNH